MSAAAKLNRLLAVRTRVIEDVEHHAEEAFKFNETSNVTLISYRITALEKAYLDFVSTTDALEEMPQYHSLENLTEVKRKNRVVQDLYLNTKFHVSGFVENEADRTLNASFFQPPRNTNESNRTSLESTPKNMGIRLEKISVPHFAGKYEKWPEFKKMFTALMKIYQGDDIERLTHLRNYLEGEAKDIVRHVNTYDTAWDLLVNQYENKHAIINAHLRSFHDIPLMSTASSIRHAITMTNSCLAGIKNLDILTDTWDPMIIFTLQEKLSFELRQKWEEERKGSHEPASLKQFLQFLETRHKISSVIPPKRTPPKINPHENVARLHRTFTNCVDDELGNPETDTTQDIETMSHSIDEDNIDAAILHNRVEKCLVCGKEHRIYLCPKLQNSNEALKIAKEKKLCLNCLYDKHETSQCTSRFTCKHCQKRHNSLLHEAFLTMNLSPKVEKTFHTQAIRRGTVLATALIPIHTSHGIITLRALIDQGSTTNLLSEHGAQLLRCKRQRIPSVPMLGLGNVNTGTATHKTSIIAGSLYDQNYRLAMPAYITHSITVIKPISSETLAQWSHLQGLQLADPNTNTNDRIDLLIGNRTFAEILDYGLIKGNEGQPIAQKTKLGWIISGGYEGTELINLNHMNVREDADEEIRINMITNEALADQLKSFWEMEEVRPHNKNWTPDEQDCYDYFMKNVSREKDGKLLMRIPFKIDPKSENFLGDSLENAKRRFLQLERRFERNPSFKEEYTKCINEYITLGHAIKVPMSSYSHVIPHHAVIKESSLTTKLRTVFDASAKTTNGYSLNDRMHVGPKILEELWAVLLRWRLGKYALTSDIEKMYRQFWVHPDDAKFQQILWRNATTNELELYELRTVTFGTTTAPFMAIQGIHIIADEIESTNPELSETIRKAFYVDDCLKSVDTIQEAVELKSNLSKTFGSYGLNLRKWNSNVEILSTQEVVDLKTHPDGHCTALGMQWNTKSDELSFKVSLKKIAKR